MLFVDCYKNLLSLTPVSEGFLLEIFVGRKIMGLMGWDGINSAVTENAWDGKKVDYGSCFVYKVEYYLMQLDS